MNKEPMSEETGREILTKLSKIDSQVSVSFSMLCCAFGLLIGSTIIAPLIKIMLMP